MHRLYIIINSVLFPIFSIACAFTHALGSMIAMGRLLGSPPADNVGPIRYPIGYP